MGFEQVEIVMEIEEVFSVQVPDSALVWSTVGQTLDWLCGELGADLPGSMWTRPTVEARLRQLVAETLSLPVERVTMNSRYAEDLRVG